MDYIPSLWTALLSAIWGEKFLIAGFFGLLLVLFFILDFITENDHRRIINNPVTIKFLILIMGFCLGLLVLYELHRIEKMPEQIKSAEMEKIRVTLNELERKATETAVSVPLEQFAHIKGHLDKMTDLFTTCDQKRDAMDKRKDDAEKKKDDLMEKYVACVRDKEKYYQQFQSCANNNS